MTLILIYKNFCLNTINFIIVKNKLIMVTLENLSISEDFRKVFMGNSGQMAKKFADAII